MTARFLDRMAAGRELAQRLAPRFASAAGGTVVVLALPRGGVPVAAEIARELGAPLDVFLVRKLGVPGQEELAFGALAEGGIRVLNDALVRDIGLSTGTIERVAAREREELERRERRYRAGRQPSALEGRVVLLVDDGLATGATMEAAVRAVRQAHPAQIVVAAPVGAPDTCRRLRGVADDVVCLATPEWFGAVGAWYDDFTQTTDDEVCRLLEERRQP